MKSKAIFLGRPEVMDKVFTKKCKEILEDNLDIDTSVTVPTDLPEQYFPLLKETEIIFSSWGMPTPDSQRVSGLFPNLKEIYYAAGSVQTFARPFFDNNIRIFSAPAANGVPVAEYTVAQIILANKGFFWSSRYQSKGNMEKAIEKRADTKGNFDCKVGLIGAGMIGSLVAKMLKNYRVEVLAFDPFLSDKRAKELGVKKASLDEIFSTCETISNHLADNDDTAGMLGRELFDKMSDTATFINTGRGRQVDETALADFMEKHPFATALLDVTFPEPPKENSPFYTLDNVILSPHIAGSIGNEVCRMGEYMTEEFLRVQKGEKPLYEVVPDMLKTMA